MNQFKLHLEVLIVQCLVSWGYKKVSWDDLWNTVGPGPKYLRDESSKNGDVYRYNANGLSVWAWFHGDTAQVMITESGRWRYAETLSRRLQLLRKAWSSRYNIEHVPNCPDCGKQMMVTHGARGGYFWMCKNEKKHKRPAFFPWNRWTKGRMKKFESDMTVATKEVSFRLGKNVPHPPFAYHS